MRASWASHGGPEQKEEPCFCNRSVCTGAKVGAGGQKGKLAGGRAPPSGGGERQRQRRHRCSRRPRRLTGYARLRDQPSASPAGGEDARTRRRRRPPSQRGIGRGAPSLLAVSYLRQSPPLLLSPLGWRSTPPGEVGRQARQQAGVNCWQTRDTDRPESAARVASYSAPFSSTCAVVRTVLYVLCRVQSTAGEHGIVVGCCQPWLHPPSHSCSCSWRRRPLRRPRWRCTPASPSSAASPRRPVDRSARDGSKDRLMFRR